MGRTLKDIEAAGGPSDEDHVLLGDVIDLLAICHHLVLQLAALEHQEGQDARRLARVSRLN